MSADALAAFRRRYPVCVEIPVAWGEMDAFGHVNNIVYFRYFESARIACFERMGYTALARDTGRGPILAWTDCRFRVPLTYPDTLTAGTGISEAGEDRFVMDYAVFSHGHGAVAAEGQGRIVSFDYRAGSKTPLPEPIAAALDDYRLGD